MERTVTINEELTLLGSLEHNEKKALQRVGVQLVDEFFLCEADKQNDETVINVLYYLTDIQVRDYAMGLLNPDNSEKTIKALNVLLEKAPTDSIYISAPAVLLASIQYEMGDKEAAFLTLDNARPWYAMKGLLHRVFNAGWPAEGFAAMRRSLHPKVVASIFEEEN